MRSLEHLRPVQGASNTITLNDGIRYVKLISKKFLCPRCKIFCGELVPVLDGATRKRLRLLPGGLVANMPRTKVFCYAGCSDHEAWGWEMFNWEDQRAIDQVREWPENWRKDKAALEKERTVRGVQERGV